MKITKSRANRVRSYLSVCALALLSPFTSRGAPADDALDHVIALDIRASTPLESALIEWGSKSGMTVMINTATVSGHFTGEIRGSLSARKALSLMLRNSGLSYTQEGNRIRVVPAPTLSRSAFHDTQLNSPSAARSEFEVLAGTRPNGDSEESGSQNGARPPDMQVVLVTAQKKTERIQDVPIPISVVNTESLQDNNQLRLQDFSSQVPGLTITPGAQSSIGITIRGITTGQGAGTTPLVGVTVDDVPFGSSLVTFVPDLDPGDLKHIEVLRGPQGTLYGASSMGGLIKYVTADPSTDAVSGRVESGTSRIYNGAKFGYSFRGTLNLPITDNLAIRASAFTRQDPGYIDNPIAVSLRGMNEDQASGARVTALWRPSETLSLRLSALYQDVHGGTTDAEGLGLNYTVNPPGSASGQYQNYAVQGVGPYDRRSQNYSAVLKDKIGIFDLTSVTGYSIYSFSDTLDFTQYLGSIGQYGIAAAVICPTCSAYTGFGEAGSGVPFDENYTNSKLTQELRLSFPIGSRIDVLLGSFYTHEYISPAQQTDYFANPNTGVVAAQFADLVYRYSYLERAVFADFTYRVTDRFDVQLGGRESHIENSTGPFIYIGSFAPVIYGQPSPYVTPAITSSSKPFTYLLSPQFKISSDLMIYGRFASGYRPGGGNPVSPYIPLVYQPDKTKNYEIGLKGDFHDHMLSVDTSLYYIDWSDIQLGLALPTSEGGFQYTGNAGRAKSEGVELQVDSRPVAGLVISGWVTWSEAILTSYPAAAVLAGVYGAPGERLPYSAPFSTNVSVNQDFPLVGQLRGFVGGAVSYVGGRYDTLQATPAREYLPAYAKTDLRAGVKDDTWTFNLYVNNVTNRRGLLTGGLPAVNPGWYYIQPRLVGLTVSKRF